MVEKEIDIWVQRLTHEDMPLFTRTVHCVAGLASEEDSSFSELTWAILQDPTLTAAILKLSNSMYYNPYFKRINTISRAVMRLGFDLIKGMCLSIALVETVLSSLHRERVAIEIARAFHAASQAKNLALRCNVSLPEEVFIAALLSRIGQIAFWCFAGEYGEKLECALKTSVREEDAEIEVLGFKLERLTLELCREWKLSELLDSVFRNKMVMDKRTQCISLGYCIAQAAEKGWNSSQIRKETSKVSDLLKISEDEASEIMHDSARIAAEITVTYGAKSSSRLIPIPEEELVQALAKIPEVKREYPKPDHQVQLASLRDLSALANSKKGDASMVLSILLEGIYRGIGMDRVLFALLTPDRQRLIGKFGLGWDNEKNFSGFQVGANPAKPNIFSYIIKNQKPMWVTDDPGNEILSMLTKEISDYLGGGPFLIMPVCITGKPIGVVYADRNLSGRDLDEESSDSFEFMGQQANMCLTALSGT
ncbi:MAG: HDOD domain-containing protein [Syntrophobacteraceae bacterium]